MTLSEAADRCVSVASLATAAVEGLSAELLSADMSKEEQVSALHLTIGSLTDKAAKAIMTEIQAPVSTPIMFHLGPCDNRNNAVGLDLKLEFELVTCLQNCKVPIVTVCNGDTVVEGSMCVLMAVADIVVMSEAAGVAISSGSISHLLQAAYGARVPHVAELPGGLMKAQDALGVGLADIVVPADEVKRELDRLLNRFSKSGPHLVRVCKTQLPADSVDQAALVMVNLRSQETKTQATGDLVRLIISESGVATVELNDPVHFNNQSPTLIADLILRLREVRAHAFDGRAKAVVLQGSGPHFCTGSWDTEGPESFRAQSWSQQMSTFSKFNEIAATIRSMPVPTISAVHGKLIGGGVAVALATDFLICAEGTTFEFGNLPRGRHPLFMLSRSLHLTLGQGSANQMYLENPLLSADEGLVAGLVHQMAEGVIEAKHHAAELASKCGVGNPSFVHGPVSRMCLNDQAHSAREVALYLTLECNQPSSRSALTPSLKPKKEMRPLLSSSAIDPKWLDVSSVELLARVRDEVRDACVSIMGANAKVKDDTPLMEAGVDSLGATELANVLSANTGLKLDSMLLFSYPTIDQLTSHLSDELQGALAPAKNISVHADPRWSNLSSEEMEAQVDDLVRSSVTTVLGSGADLDDDMPLMEAGVDSLEAMELANVLNAETSLRLDSMVLFSHPSIEALKSHILTELAEPPQATAAPFAPKHTPSKRNNTTESQIAIVGMSGRFPGGIEGPAMLWDVVQGGKCMLGKVPFGRWDADAIKYFDKSLTDDMALRMSWGGFSEDLELFDSRFFGISPSEAHAMDPQHRMLLEYSYLALRDAGYNNTELLGHNVGVFVGMMAQDANNFTKQLPDPKQPHICGAWPSIVHLWTARTMRRP